MRSGALGFLWLLVPAEPAGSVQAPVQLQSNQPATSPVDVYLLAHEDDWQLFMGDAVSRRHHQGARQVFVYLTAGDAGRDSSYWRTRELATLHSIAALDDSAAREPANDSCDNPAINGHSMRRCTVGQTRVFFLRLPDGRRNGHGYKRNGYASLRKLNATQVRNITALDRSTTYAGWGDVESTVRAIVVTESPFSLTLNANDPNVLINPHDHFDHRMAGHIAADLARSARWPAVYYLGYALAAKDDNLPPSAQQTKSRLFLAYDSVMVRGSPRWSALGEHRTFYLECLRRTYWRRVP